MRQFWLSEIFWHTKDCMISNMVFKKSFQEIPETNPFYFEKGIPVGAMQHPIMLVESTQSIAETLGQLKGQEGDLAGYAVEGTHRVAHRDDLVKMSDMGLAELPISSIAI